MTTPWRIIAMALVTLIFVMGSTRILLTVGHVGFIGPSLASLVILVIFAILDYWQVRLFSTMRDERSKVFARRLRPLIQLVFYSAGLWLLLAV